MISASCFSTSWSSSWLLQGSSCSSFICEGSGSSSGGCGSSWSKVESPSWFQSCRSVRTSSSLQTWCCETSGEKKEKLINLRKEKINKLDLNRLKMDWSFSCWRSRPSGFWDRTVPKTFRETSVLFWDRKSKTRCLVADVKKTASCLGPP